MCSPPLIRKKKKKNRWTRCAHPDRGQIHSTGEPTVPPHLCLLRLGAAHLVAAGRGGRSAASTGSHSATIGSAAGSAATSSCVRAPPPPPGSASPPPRAAAPPLSLLLSSSTRRTHEIQAREVAPAALLLLAMPHAWRGGRGRSSRSAHRLGPLQRLQLAVPPALPRCAAHEISMRRRWRGDHARWRGEGGWAPAAGQGGEHASWRV